MGAHTFEELLYFITTFYQCALYSTKRKSKLGYFKSETGDEKITKFLGIRSKTYAFKTAKSSSKKCKGIARRFNKNIPFSAYEKCVSEIAECSASQISLRSFNHEVKMLKSTKLAFSSYDDKRYILPCGIHTLPYGSREINENLKECSFC